jgi:poly-gamma-glutamate capsule biosynthesis protein CapA/YwtB (metallophosphatase superfamily)
MKLSAGNLTKSMRTRPGDSAQGREAVRKYFWPVRSDRRRFLALAAAAAWGTVSRPARGEAPGAQRSNAAPLQSATVKLFLCGDVMTGRGIDQILPHPADPYICEPWVESALTYVELAEAASGVVPKPVDFLYIWGNALAELEHAAPDARIINLETSVTARGNCTMPGISYRMNPENLPCLTAAEIDCCVLANNHVLDWGRTGLADTLDSLKGGGLKIVGAGRDAGEAAAPAILDLPGKGRILVFAAGFPSSGIPNRWAAMAGRPGVNFFESLSDDALAAIATQVRSVKRQGDIAVASVHWGGNWGYEVPAGERRFAHGLIDNAGIDIVHGHSSHHVKGIEVYRGRLVLYGCGDFLNDYEGIRGYEQFRDDLVLMYFPRVAVEDGRLVECRMVPLRIRKFRLNRASRSEAEWLCATLNREGKRFGTAAEMTDGGHLRLRWD